LITIRATGQHAEQELRSLFMWLQDEADVRQHAQISLESGIPAAGEMGGELEVIQLIVDSSFQALNLALAYAAWRGTRSARPLVTIEWGESKSSSTTMKRIP
jgi:Effector Associated Constant Component 1